MTYEQWKHFLYNLECVTIRMRPYAKPDSLRLTDRLHAKKITQKQAARLVKRLVKSGHLEV